MKNWLIYSFIALLSGSLFISCGGEDDEDNTPEIANHMIIDGVEYDLSAGFIENYGTDSWHEGYNTDLTLYSEGISVVNNELVGAGHIIYFEMFSSTSSSLDSDDYNYSSNEPHPIGTFDYGLYLVNGNFETEEVEDIDDITEGTVSVSLTGNEYSITFDCVSFGEKEMSGYYKGTLEFFDYTEVIESPSTKSLKTKKRFFQK
ncbi:MAG: hypothetical protein JXR07_04185 [Reichenbachiella sp.]